jgi:hypothetical protein
LLVVLGIGPEQLTQRVVDLDPLDAEQRSHDQDGENDHRQDRRLDRDQPHALEPEGDALARRRLLDGLDVDVTFGVLVEHTLSSSHVGLLCSLVLCSLVARMRRCQPDPIGASH